MVSGKPLTYEEWIKLHVVEIEAAWQTLIDEYGDSAPLLSTYKWQKYNEYLNSPVW